MPNPAIVYQDLQASIPQRVIANGYVSTSLPAPSSFTAPLYVIVPEHSTQVPIGPCDWGALHGTSLPKQGAQVYVAFGENEVPVVVWWEGAQSESLILAGFMVASARKTAPTGWLACEGQSLLRTEYAALFAAIGTEWGSVDGTHFTLPDGRDRTLIGAGTHALGSKGGEATVKLTAGQSGVPAHTHKLGANTVRGAPGGAYLATGANFGTFYEETEGVVGGAKAAAEAHENMPPFFTGLWLIKT